MTQTLLVDTNRAAVPIFRALRELGHDVWVVGSRPTETLAKLADDHYFQLDYSKPETLDAFVTERGFDYLIPGCTDLSYRVCAEINRGRFPGIQEPELNHTINTKNDFRKLAEKNNIPVPMVLSPDATLGYSAVIVKPVDSFSGRGIKIVRDPAPASLSAAVKSVRKASRSGEVVVEEFVEGQLYSHSAFFSENAIHADFIVQENCVANPFAVDVSRVMERFPSELLDSLRRDILRLAMACGFVNGLIHTQFIASADRYWVIEMTRRCPGDIYSMLIEFATGYPYAANYAAGFLGKHPLIRKDMNIKEHIIRHTVSPPMAVRLWGYRFTQPVEIKLFVPLATSGDQLGAGPDGRAGIFFFRASTLEAGNILYDKLLNGTLFAYDPEWT